MIGRLSQGTPRTHAIRLIVAWAVISVIGMVIASQLPIPPGPESSQGQGETSTLVLLTILSWPVLVGVALFILYHGVLFRTSPRAPLQDGPPDFGNLRVQIAWVAISSLLVLVLAVVGIVTMASEGAAQAVGAGGRAIGSSGGANQTVGQVTGGKPLQVQVIAQQWFFTYRFPQYSGVETDHLMLPVNVPVELHVTSLDVIHSWWAYQLGIKADANPGIDNVANVTPKHLGSFQVRCAELCGIWHGEMIDSHGAVVSSSQFDTWIRQQVAADKEILKYLPKYSPTYIPEPKLKAG
jgi:cytochrome c oxidase subunit 2